MKSQGKKPQVGIIMGSTSDWKTMSAAAQILGEFEVAHEKNVVSAHRTPLWLAEYARTAQQRGLQIIIAGAGGAGPICPAWPRPSPRCRSSACRWKAAR